MHFVLDEKVDQRNQSREKSSSEILSQLDGLRVWRTQCNATDGPRQSGNQIADHENIMPIVVIGRRNICPSSTRQSPEYSNASHEVDKSIAAIGLFA